MKKLIFTIFSISVVIWSGCSGGPKKLPTEITFVKDFEAAKAEAAKAKKSMVIDFYTSWCDWCDTLDADTFKDSLIIDMSKDFVFVKVDGEADSVMTQKFSVTGYPMVVITKPDGQEIDRVQGYLSPADFYNQVQLYLQGRETLEDYLTRLQDEPDNPDYLMTIGEKYLARSDWQKAIEYYKRVLALDTDNKRNLGSRALKAIGEVYGSSKDYKSAIQTCKDIITRFPTSLEAEDAAAMIGYYTAQSGDEKEALALYREYLQKYPEGRNAWVQKRVADLEEKL